MKKDCTSENFSMSEITDRLKEEKLKIEGWVNECNLESAKAQALRSVNATDNVKPLPLPYVHQVECRTGWNPVHVPCLQSPLRQCIFVYISNLRFPWNKSVIKIRVKD
jgi:hypothetical protein